MTKALILILAVIIGIFVWVVAQYNIIIRMIEAIRNNFKQIDIQLDRRYKVFESLINVVKNYMDYEKSTLKDVVALRNQAQTAAKQGDTKGQFAAEDAISKIASNINLVFEQYPDLKASQNALQLQEEIVNTENKLTFSKQAYNDSIERYNAFKKQFFQSIVVSAFAAALDKDFTYWGLSEEKIKSQEEYTVKL
jgi:LemA protein